jgi:hypothetical protein
MGLILIFTNPKSLFLWLFSLPTAIVLLMLNFSYLNMLLDHILTCNTKNMVSEICELSKVKEMGHSSQYLRREREWLRQLTKGWKEATGMGGHMQQHLLLCYTRCSE